MLFQMEFTKSVVCFMKNDIAIGSGVIIVINNNLFLCTCKHVVQPKDTGNAPDSIMVNHKSLTKNQLTIFPANFKCHKDADIAITPLNIPLIIETESDMKGINEPSLLFYGNNNFSNLGIGDAVFVLGFPLGLVGENKNYPILKGGVIARLDSECIEQGKHFLIDSNIFPGNSGGPVFVKPEAYGVEGTNPIQQGYLLGIVSGYIPYVDNLISQQTGKIVSTNQEHSGLSKIVPIHYAKELYDEHFPQAIPN